MTMTIVTVVNMIIMIIVTVVTMIIMIIVTIIRSVSLSPAEVWLVTDESDPATSCLLSTMKAFGG